MRFGGTTMSIILTDLSRVSALGNSLKGCSQRPQTHRRSGPINPVPSQVDVVCFLNGPNAPGQDEVEAMLTRRGCSGPRAARCGHTFSICRQHNDSER